MWIRMTTVPGQSFMLGLLFMPGPTDDSWKELLYRFAGGSGRCYVADRRSVYIGGDAFRQ